jgi:hypothetical protein
MVVVVVVGASVVVVGGRVVVGASVVVVGGRVVVVGWKAPVADDQMRKPAPVSARTQRRVTTITKVRDLRGAPLVPG